MKKYYVLLVLIILAVIAAPISMPGSASAKTKVLRLVVPTPPNEYPLSTSLIEMAEKFNQRTQGKYKIEVHAGGALAKLPEYFDAIRIGAVEMGSVAWTIFSFMDPRLGIIETPFLFNNYEASNWASDQLLPLYDEILQEKFNAKALQLISYGASEFVTNNPVHGLDDLKGVLVGAVSPVSGIMLKDLGAAPVTIMWSDMYESLQKNVVDSVVTMVTAGIVMNLFDVCKHVTEFYGTATYQGLSINLDVWNKMPPQIQTILNEEVAANLAYLNNVWPEYAASNEKKLMDQGVTFYRLPSAERAKWAAATTAYRQKQLSSYGAFGEKVGQIAQEANSRFPYGK